MTIAADATSQARARNGDEEARNGEQEMKSAAETWQIVGDVAVTGLFALAVLAALYLMKEVVVPIILAWVVANILLPVVNAMERNGMPRVASVGVVTLALMIILLTIVMLLSLPLTYWLSRATELGAVLREKLRSMAGPFDFLNELSRSIGQITGSPGTGLHVEENTNIVSGIISILTPAVTQGVLFLGALIFYLIYQKKIKNRSVLVLPTRDARLTSLRIYADIEHNTTVYFGTFTIVNLGLGVVTTLLAWAVGLPNPMLWGVLAAVLNYIPYIGAALMIAILFLVGLFTFSATSEALVAPLVYIGISTVEGHFITPALMGRRMTMNPFAVFLAIGFWTWMWGPIGAFVAVPILMTTIVTFRHLFPRDTPELPD
ncbi:AI-2E family transporter [Hyphomicrobium sp. CS1GBMeth3]|uniref:AI-2E family transporter n=1 Tax=Hyphomicrobium sp. CS1GBMeth3 TaxID=1892845 RepID=UPI00092FDFEF|nr:AI-2E family transporter [Hyphomicrobium sp. CS1GBMeth3]